MVKRSVNEVCPLVENVRLATSRRNMRGRRIAAIERDVAGNPKQCRR
jgi:hypothetical protein